MTHVTSSQKVIHANLDETRNSEGEPCRYQAPCVGDLRDHIFLDLQRLGDRLSCTTGTDAEPQERRAHHALLLVGQVVHAYATSGIGIAVGFESGQNVGASPDMNMAFRCSTACVRGTSSEGR